MLPAYVVTAAGAGSGAYAGPVWKLVVAVVVTRQPAFDGLRCGECGERLSSPGWRSAKPSCRERRG